MVIVLVVIGYLMLIITAVTVQPPQLSPRELERRLKERHSHLTLDQLRYRYNGYLEKVQTFLVIAACVVITLLAASVFGTLIAILLTIVVAALRSWLARYLWAARLARVLYRKYERDLLLVARRYARPLYVVFGAPVGVVDYQLGSHDELYQLIAGSTAVLAADQQKLVLAALRFTTSRVRDCLQPIDAVISIDAEQLIGPLVLDELFKSAQQVFPVIEGSLDQTIGVLEIKELLTLRSKRTQTARALMMSGVSQLGDEQDLLVALRILLREGSRLAVVRTAVGTAVGVVTLSAVVEQLIGDATDRPPSRKMV